MTVCVEVRIKSYPSRAEIGGGEIRTIEGVALAHGMIKWRCTFYGEIEPMVWCWGVRSFDPARPTHTHEVSIDLHTGVCFCTCEYATFSKLNTFQPTIVGLCCKHARRVLQEADWIQQQETQHGNQNTKTTLPTDR